MTLTGDPDGTEWWSHTYAWLWDEEAGAATQVWPALTDDVRCGNVTQDIEAEDGTIWFIDKHAAHERVNFDRLQAMAEPPMSQQLLTPLAAKLAAEDAAAVL